MKVVRRQNKPNKTGRGERVLDSSNNILSGSDIPSVNEDLQRCTLVTLFLNCAREFESKVSIRRLVGNEEIIVNGHADRLVLV